MLQYHWLGIIIGEIGPKLGMNTNDNGYLGFEKFRIPRTQMLMKHSQVLEVYGGLFYCLFIIYLFLTSLLI